MRSDQSKPSAGTDAWCSATGPVFGTLAAATAADSAYGLDAVGFEDALGIAATQSGGLMAPNLSRWSSGCSTVSRRGTA